jgi:large subunit ribosomal protein L4
MKLTVFNTDGTSSKSKDFAGFPQLEGNKGRMALRQVVLAIQANLRQGNASTKTRAEVSGSGKKPFRQKGTGMARRGSSRSPLLRGGGVVFGPRPRDYSQKVNRKVRKLALTRALQERAEDSSILVIESWNVEQPKTREFTQVLDRIHSAGKVLLVDDDFSDNMVLSSRNVERVHIAQSGTINAYDLVRFPTILFTEKALNTVLAKINGGAS